MFKLWVTDYLIYYWLIYIKVTCRLESYVLKQTMAYILIRAGDNIMLTRVQQIQLQKSLTYKDMVTAIARMSEQGFGGRSLGTDDM